MDDQAEDRHKALSSGRQVDQVAGDNSTAEFADVAGTRRAPKRGMFANADHEASAVLSLKLGIDCNGLVNDRPVLVGYQRSLARCFQTRQKLGLNLCCVLAPLCTGSYNYSGARQFEGRSRQLGCQAESEPM